MITIARSVELEEPKGRKDHVVISMKLSLLGLVACEKCSRKSSVMVECGQLDLGQRTQRDKERSNSYVKSQWGQARAPGWQ